MTDRMLEFAAKPRRRGKESAAVRDMPGEEY